MDPPFCFTSAPTTAFLLVIKNDMESRHATLNRIDKPRIKQETRCMWFVKCWADGKYWQPPTLKFLLLQRIFFPGESFLITFIDVFI